MKEMPPSQVLGQRIIYTRRHEKIEIKDIYLDIFAPVGAVGVCNQFNLPLSK